MRWKCPHCSVKLAVADDKLGTGWNFSRCYQCGGFALIRRNDSTLIKVDRAPATGDIIQGAREEEIPLLSQAAAQNLSRLQKSAQRPPATPPQFNPGPAASSLFGVPAPLPEVPERSLAQRTLPVAIGIAAAVAVASGGYLFVQGRSLSERVRASSNESTAARKATQNDAPVVAANAPTVTDHLRERAMAPTRARTDQTQMKVHPRSPGVSLHAGPGTSFPVLGTADAANRYAVLEWNEKWFKVSVPGAEGKAEITAWIRNDQVQLVTEKSK